MEQTRSPQRLANRIAAELDGLPSRTTPAVRSLRREYSRSLADEPPDLVIRVALDLANRGDFSRRFLAYELVQHHPAAFTSLTHDQLLKLGEGIDSWRAVDCFACYLSGPAWQDGRLSKKTIREWTKSADHWRRRAALVSTIALSRRGKAGDIRKVLEICALAISDRHDMVVKALSWALRELAKNHSAEAQEFLERHRSSLAPRVIREVQNKLTTGLKNPRRRLA